MGGQNVRQRTHLGFVIAGAGRQAAKFPDQRQPDPPLLCIRSANEAEEPARHLPSLYDAPILAASRIASREISQSRRCTNHPRA
jgi:hypothetical protein